jgi:hypothetical protein
MILILDLHRLVSRSLILPLDSVYEALSDLVRNICYMRASLDGRNQLAKDTRVLKP